MRAVIVYESVSISQVTANVAETIRAVLKENEVDVDSFAVANADKTAVKGYDALLAGAPTMGFKSSPGMIKFLESLKGEELAGKLAAAFDTQVKFRFSGSAAKGIEGKLKELGFKLVAEPLIAYVKGAGKNQWQFEDGEQEKAKKWAQELAETLRK